MPDEAKELKRINATPVPNSGRGIAKGDGILEPFLVDIKEGQKQFVLNKQVWAKISTDSVKNGRRHPTLRIVLGPDNDPKTRLWIVGDDMFLSMLDAWRQVYGQEDAS